MGLPNSLSRLLLEEQPIPFIVGVPRSGTTLLRIILDSHPMLSIPPESHFVNALIEIDLTDVDNVFQTIINNPSWIDFGINIDNQVLFNLLKHYQPLDLGKIIKITHNSYKITQNKKYWGDKTPNHLYLMEQIQESLPQAHFIHLIRDGRDVALSLRGKWFGPQDITQQAIFWKDRIIAARNVAPNLNNYIEIKYEDLILNTESVLRRILKFINLEFTPELLRYYERTPKRLSELQGRKFLNISGDDHREIFKYVYKPPQRSRINRWKREMTKKEQRQFLAVTEDLLLELGYEV